MQDFVCLPYQIWFLFCLLKTHTTHLCIAHDCESCVGCHREIGVGHNVYIARSPSIHRTHRVPVYWSGNGLVWLGMGDEIALGPTTIGHTQSTDISSGRHYVSDRPASLFDVINLDLCISNIMCTFVKCLPAIEM